jgi:hypothetical protein
MIIKLRTANLVVLAALLAVPVRSQNNEPIYRSWFWEETPSNPRVAGLGGAYVGLADDANSVFLNPAGLMTLPRPGDLQVSRTERPGHDLSTGDSLTAHQHFDGSVGLRLSPRFGIGFAAVSPKADQTFIGAPCVVDKEGHLPPLCSEASPVQYGCSILGDGSCDLASMNVPLRTYAFAVAYQPWSFPLSVGVSFGWQAIRADGISNRCDRPAPDRSCAEPRMPDMHDNATRAKFWNLWGVRYQAGNVAIGASFRLPVRFDFRRSLATTGAHVPAAAPGPAPPGYVMTVPARASLGSSWRQDFHFLGTPGRFLTSVEIDHVQYSQIAESFTIEPGAKEFQVKTNEEWLDPRTSYSATDYHLDDAFEFRAGAELTLRSIILRSNKVFRKVGVQARGGFYRPGRGSLRYDGSSDETSPGDPVFVGPEPEREWSWGVSVNFSLLRIEYSHVYGGYRPQSLIGVSVRYPGFF